MNKLKSKKVIIGIIIIFVLIVITSISTYFVIINNPNFRIKATIGYMFEIADNFLKETEKSEIVNAFLDKKLVIKGKFSPNIKFSNSFKKTVNLDKLENLINSSYIETNVNSDIQNKYINANISYNNINADVHLNNNDMYLQIKDYYDKYIKLNTKSDELEDVFKTVSSNIKIEEIRYMMNILKNCIKNSIDEKNITRISTDITIDEEKIDVNKITFKMDNKYMNKLEQSLLNKILNNEKAKQITFKLFSNKYKNITEFENNINLELEKIKKETTEKNEIVAEYIIYTNGIFNTTVRQELKIIDIIEEVLQYTTYKSIKFDECISYYKNNELVAESNIKNISKNIYDITTSIGKNTSFDIKGKLNEKNTDLDYVVRLAGMDEIKGNLKIDTNKINNKEMNQRLNLIINADKTYGILNLKCENNFKIVESITKPNFTESVDIKDITKIELNNIFNKFQTLNEKLIKDIIQIGIDLGIVNTIE
ncbi:MAG: hypothetical protein RR144_04115 [Clostridia bacterium]